MNADRKTIDDYDHLQEITKCAILHSQGRRNVDIKRELGISAVRVTRALGEAPKVGIMKVAVYPPGEESTAGQLLDRYKKNNLREACVFHIGIDDDIIPKLGELAAYYIDDILDGKGVNRIAVGPGRTMLAFARALSDKKRPQMKIGSTISEEFLESYVAPGILISIAAEKWECELYNFDPKSSSGERRDYADVLVFGIGIIEKVISEDVRDLVPEAGIDVEVIKQAKIMLQARGAAGIINYQPIDREGNPIPWNVKEIDCVLGNRALSLDIIKEIAADESKRVVCVVGGKEKVNAIKAGLKGGYFNTIITDFETAEEVLK